MELLDDKILVQEKQHAIVYYVQEQLEKGIAQLEHKKEVIITTNTKHNFDVLLKEWNQLVDEKDLTIIFAHPELNETWVIRPHIHHKITDEEKLEEGLTSLFENVPRV